jgi:PqqD family protein of HPr-rel-A system
MDKPTRHGKLTGRTRDGWAVYHPETDEVHMLNESAKAIWELCDGSTTTSEMASAISEVTGIGLDQAVADVDEAVTSLAALGLVS